MNKEFEDIRTLLNARAEELNNMRSNRLKEIKEAEKKYMDLQKALDNAETAEDFIRIKGELKEQEEACRFLTSHKNREPKYNLAKAEYREISGKISKGLEELRTEYAPQIAKALEGVVEVATKYADEASCLEALESDASRLANGFSPNRCRLPEIENTVEDPLGYIHAFYRTFFYAWGNVKTAESAINNPFRARSLNNETMPIYTYLMKIKAEQSEGHDKE